MITNVLKSANSTSIAIKQSIYADRFPNLDHPTSVVFSENLLTRDDLRHTLKGNLVPGIITGLGFTSMTPFDPRGADWVNLREHSSSIKEINDNNQIGGIPEIRITGTALVMDPADIRSAIAKGVVATIPVWEVEYSSRVFYTSLLLGKTRPPVKLGARLGRLPKNHSFEYKWSDNSNERHTMTMTAKKSVAKVTAKYHPFSEL